LKLDVYEPQGDPATARPVVVWMHGFGAASSEKASPLDVEIITRFVLHGAVVVSFNYRVDGSQTDAQLGEDPNAAVAWVRAHADQYRIDVDRIAFAGISAGACRTMRAAYDGDITAGEPPVESRVRAVLSFSGTGPTDTIQAGEPPLFMAHGKLDVDVPYANAVATCEAAKAAGVPCEFHAYADADHFGLFRYADDLEALGLTWLYDALDLANAQNPPLPTTTTTTTQPTTTTTTVSERPVPPPASPVDGVADHAG
jgi:alpha-L-fucosidase 2